MAELFFNAMLRDFDLGAPNRLDSSKNEFQTDSDRRNIRKLNEVIESQQGEIYCVLQGDEQVRRDQQLLHEQLFEQNRDFREAHEKSFIEMEELKKFQGSKIWYSFKEKIR